MKCNKIVCVDKKPEDLGKLFFGDTGKYHRIDRTYFEIFKKLAETSESNTWFMNEISYDRDKAGWETLPENAKRMFKLNIIYQTLMDNGVPNIFFPLSEFVSDSWLSYLYARIGAEEKIHCLPDDTEILTTDGWVELKHLTADHDVANWYKDGTIKFTKPSSIQKQYYSGDMVSFDTHNFHLMVTQKHRMVGIDKQKEHSYIVKEAKNINTSDVFIPYFNSASSNWLDDFAPEWIITGPNSVKLTLLIPEWFYIRDNSIGKSIVKWEGNIVGVEVPSTFIVVRTNKKHIVVTGNSLSYSSGITQVFGDKGSEILDLVYDDALLKRRMEKEVEVAEKFLSSPLEDNDETKQVILELLLRVFFLEGVKFPFSFFVTWTINKAYDNAIQGFSQLLKLIAWDEMTVHTTTGSQLIKTLRTDKSQGFSHLVNSEWFSEMAHGIAEEVAELEKEWSEYLLKEGSIPGYTKEVGEHVINYFTDQRLKELKLEPIFDEPKSGIIDWYNEYRDLNKTQVALQEADATNYQKGKLKNDFDSYDWSKLKGML